jgi:multidrug efflux system outer membrane protein
MIGDFGGESTALSSLVQSGARIWSIGFALAQPIFTAGRLSAEVDATTARQKQALASYQKSIQTAFREVSDALVNVSQTAATEIDLQSSVDAAQDALRLSGERYEAGYSAYLNVLDAQRSLSISQLAMIRNRQALLSASVDDQALGRDGPTNRFALRQTRRLRARAQSEMKEAFAINGRAWTVLNSNSEEVTMMKAAIQLGARGATR